MQCGGVGTWSGHGLVSGVSTVVPSVVLLLWVILVCSLLTYVERKVLGSAHRRMGPSVVGWNGVLQVVADGAKLLVKHVVMVCNGITGLLVSRSVGYVLATTLLAVYLLQSGCVLYSWTLVLAVATCGHLSSIGLAAGRRGNVWVDIGVQRALALLLVTDLSLAALLVGVLSSDLGAECSAVPVWTLLLLSYLLVMDTGRVPFDLVEAESELVCGAWTTVGGIVYGLLAAAEYCMSVLAVTWLSLIVGVTSAVTYTCLVVCTLMTLSLIRGLLPRTRMMDVSHYTWSTVLPLGLLASSPLSTYSMRTLTALAWSTALSARTSLLSLALLLVCTGGVLASTGQPVYVLAVLTASGILLVVCVWTVARSSFTLSGGSVNVLWVLTALSSVVVGSSTCVAVGSTIGYVLAPVCGVVVASTALVLWILLVD